MPLKPARMVCADRRLHAIALVLLAIVTIPASGDTADFPHSKESEHFKVFYDGDDPSVLDRVLQQAEEGLWSASRLTHVPIPNDKISLVLHAKPGEALVVKWPYGKRQEAARLLPFDPARPITILFDASENDMPREAVVRHETAHAFVMAHLKEHYAHIPMWLDEGIAQLAACEDRYSPSTFYQAVSKRQTLPLDAQAPPESEEERRLVHALGADLLRYLIRREGESPIGDILPELADGKAFPEALEAATRLQLDSFERTWLADLREPFGVHDPAKDIAVSIIAASGVVALALLLRTDNHRRQIHRGAQLRTPRER